MLNFLTGIKEKLILVMGTIIAALLAYTRIQSTRMRKQTEGYEKERQDRMKELYEKKAKATKAMVDGLQNESKDRTRGHFDRTDT